MPQLSTVIAKIQLALMGYFQKSLYESHPVVAVPVQCDCTSKMKKKFFFLSAYAVAHLRWTCSWMIIGELVSYYGSDDGNFVTNINDFHDIAVNRFVCMLHSRNSSDS